MLDHPDIRNISIDNHKQEIFLTFMLAHGVCIISKLNLVNVEVISNI